MLSKRFQYSLFLLFLIIADLDSNNASTWIRKRKQILKQVWRATLHCNHFKVLVTMLPQYYYIFPKNRTLKSNQSLNKSILWTYIYKPKVQSFRYHLQAPKEKQNKTYMGFLDGKVVKNHLPMQETQEMVTHSRILAWEIPWIEEPSMGSKKSQAWLSN